MNDEDYNRLEQIYKHFDCENQGKIKRLQEIYLKTGCTLLADAFETTREKNIEEQLIDPANYISLPQLSFDSMLKLTKVELDLFTPDQVEMYRLFKSNTRGGIYYLSKKIFQGQS